MLEGILLTAGTSGALTLNWAQLAADPTDAVIYANSYVTVERVA
jgi:hypothetical protein